MCWRKRAEENVLKNENQYKTKKGPPYGRGLNTKNTDNAENTENTENTDKAENTENIENM